MNIQRLATCLGVGLISLGAGAVWAQSTTASAAAKPVVHHKPAAHSAAAAKPVIEPGSVQALVRMSAYLRTLPAFQVAIATQRDEVDDYGQLVTLSGQTTYKVKMPDALFAQVDDGEQSKRYVYDGKSVTLYDPKTGFFTHFAAPPTIRQTLDAAAEKYGITIPLEDLFHWGQSDDEHKGLTSGHYVGEATLDGHRVQQYAFRQAGVDWQIWIAKGDKPVPLRVVIVASDDPARPQFESDLTWDTAPHFAADTFVFTPPANAKAIPIVSATR